MSICSEDLRQRVRKYIGNGGKQVDAVRLFGVSRQSIYKWMKNLEPAKKSGRKNPLKVNDKLIKEHVTKFPDMILRERAEVFNLSINGMWKALRRLNIRKKNDAIQGTYVYKKD